MEEVVSGLRVTITADTTAFVESMYRAAWLMLARLVVPWWDKHGLPTGTGDTKHSPSSLPFRRVAS